MAFWEVISSARRSFEMVILNRLRDCKVPATPRGSIAEWLKAPGLSNGRTPREPASVPN
jgi:hypothetical protein